MIARKASKGREGRQREGAEAGKRRSLPEASGPQLRFIHIHQLFRIQYTCFQLDTVNSYWWICIIFCRVSGGHRGMEEGEKIRLREGVRVSVQRPGQR